MTGKERLQILHDALLVDEDRHLDMRLWMRITIQNYVEKNYCGSVCCALGFACTLPELQREGLNFSNFSKGVGVGAIEKDLVPTFENRFGIHVATKFFEISFEHAMYAFATTYYDEPPTKREVCARIMEILKA
jgi:hypothetical protein